jgi:hypothetical protein
VAADKNGASANGHASVEGAAGAAHADAELNVAVSGAGDVPATPSVEFPELDK